VEESLAAWAGADRMAAKARAVTKMIFFMTVLQLGRKQGRGKRGQTGQISK
jgi:hypothetical protein